MKVYVCIYQCIITANIELLFFNGDINIVDKLLVFTIKFKKNDTYTHLFMKKS